MAHHFRLEAPDLPLLRSPQLMTPVATLHHHSPSEVNGHHDLFQGSVASPLPNAVYGALHLTSPKCRPSQAVGCRQAQVVLAVGGDHHAAGAGGVGDHV